MRNAEALVCRAAGPRGRLHGGPGGGGRRGATIGGGSDCGVGRSVRCARSGGGC